VYKHHKEFLLYLISSTLIIDELIAAIHNDIKIADESLELDENKNKENLIQQFFNSKI
jgi:hypothetical protein